MRATRYSAEHIENQYIKRSFEFFEVGGGGLSTAKAFFGTLYSTIGTECSALAESKFDGIAGEIVAGTALYALTLCFFIAATNAG